MIEDHVAPGRGNFRPGSDGPAPSGGGGEPDRRLTAQWPYDEFDDLPAVDMRPEGVIVAWLVLTGCCPGVVEDVVGLHSDAEQADQARLRSGAGKYRPQAGELPGAHGGKGTAAGLPAAYRVRCDCHRGGKPLPAASPGHRFARHAQDVAGDQRLAGRQFTVVTGGQASRMSRSQVALHGRGTGTPSHYLIAFCPHRVCFIRTSC